jgi:hypothetical protein
VKLLLLSSVRLMSRPRRGLSKLKSVYSGVIYEKHGDIFVNVVVQNLRKAR